MDINGGWGNWPGSASVMCWRRTFQGLANQVEAARRFPAYLLAGTGCEGDAEWITAELVSNALVHSRSGEWQGRFGIEVRLGGFVQVAVFDQGGRGVPRVAPESAPEDLREHGRGLLGISRLATEMGVYGTPITGHMVWARLEVKAEPLRRAS